MSKKTEQNEAIEALRAMLKPGDTVYTVLRSTSRSGMNRKIDLYLIQDNDPRWISGLAARAAGFTFDRKRDAISVGGCGMDMGFHLVYSLSRVLFRDQFKCIGAGCPANDHNNAYCHSRQHECLVCRKQVNGSKLKRKNTPDSPHEYTVCSDACATGEWLHSDAGYALKHKWM